MWYTHACKAADTRACFNMDDVRMCKRRKGALIRTCCQVLGPSQDDFGRLVGSPKLATALAFT